MSIFVAPVRLFLIALFILLAYLMACLSFLIDPIEPDEEPKPFSPWRRKTRDIAAKLLVIAHFFAGFHKIKFKGRRAQPWEAPLLIAAPHCSFLDTLPIVAMGAPSLVGKSSLVNAPFLGKMILLTQPITVTRECKNSRKETILKIQERARLIRAEKDSCARDGSCWSQVLIFPEGTVTNRSQLLAFKPGAFYPQLPVQPVCLKWPKNPDYTSWTFEGIGAFKLLWLNLCQWENSLEIEFLPVYRPNEVEKRDGRLFAENVRTKMAQCLKMPMSDLAFEDVPYVTACGKGKMTKFMDICQKLSLSTISRHPNELQTAWQSLQSNSEYSDTDSHVTFGQFAEFLNLETTSDHLLRLFVMFDWKCERRIDLREFIIVRHGVNSHSEFLHTSFKILTEKSCEKDVSEDVWVKILRLPFQFSRHEIQHMCRCCRNQFGDLSFDSFIDFLSSNGSYAHILGLESVWGS